jgi:ribonuclease R
VKTNNRRKAQDSSDKNKKPAAKRTSAQFGFDRIRAFIEKSGPNKQVAGPTLESSKKPEKSKPKFARSGEKAPAFSKPERGPFVRGPKPKQARVPTEALGVVKRHPDGFGFFVADDMDQPDVYIPRQSMQGVMTNDRVRLSISREKGGDRFRGEVQEIVSRSVQKVMGAFVSQGPGRGLLRDKSFAWGDDLQVVVPSELKPKDGELVVVQIETYPDSVKGFTGRALAIIGDAEDPLNDSLRMLHTHQIPFEFSAACLREAAQIPTEVMPADKVGRKDLTDLPIVTIDGNTAKDFDDAVFVSVEKAGFRLIVAIADVSHYVKPDTAINQDAYERGTSTYFPNFVSPMLPEKLSNELCSLKPNVERLALVADMNLDFQAQLVSSSFYEAVIKSQARVTYGQAQEIIDGTEVEGFAHVKENILRSADLAKLLMAKRFREGSLDLDLPETEIEVDETGRVVDIMRSERLFSHRLIEELMLMANVAVARHFKANDVPALYRIHDEPRAEAMQTFATFLKAFGHKEKFTGGHLQNKITKALESFKGHPKEHIINTLALRSLAQAKYSPDNVGHFGLGFSDYAHFTSPIRRFPDLIVHRQLKALICPKKGYALRSYEELATDGTVLSGCEQRSVKAERQIHSIKKARFLAQHLGEEFDGMITSVARFGLFVLLRQFDVDGLVRVEQLGGDRFDFDEEKLRLVARKSGMAYEIGDPLRIQVARVDTELGQIDFVLAEAPKNVGKFDSSLSQRPTPEKNSGRSGHTRFSRARRPR